MTATSSEIRSVTVLDLPKLESCAKEFYASSEFLKGFDLSRFCELWQRILESDTGVIFAVDGNDGQYAGAIGGLMFDEIYSGRKTATELYWFVRDGHRGHGLKLYRAFEAWARERGCEEIRMIHLMDSMPEKLNRVYQHLGFRPIETHFAKELT